jgi:hypothetical protein
MRLVIAWRNPLPVQTVQRFTRVSENGSCALLFRGRTDGRGAGRGVDRFVHHGNTTRGKYSRALCGKNLRSMHHEGREPKEGHLLARGTQSVVVKGTTCPSNRIVARVYYRFEERAIRNSQGTGCEGDTAS